MLKTLSLNGIKKQMSTLALAERMFDSIVLFALFECGALRALANGPKSFDQLSSAVGGDAGTLRATLDAAVGLRIISKEQELYEAPEPLLDCLGRTDSPEYLGEWVALIHALARPLLDLGDAIATGAKPGALYDDMSGDNPPAQRMTQAMDSYARSRGIEIANRIDFSTCRTFLDLGCGPGTYSLAILERYPNIRATLLDLPGPIAEARRLVANRDMTDRVSFVAIDAMDYGTDQTYDTVLVSNTLHMIGPSGSQALLKHCFDLVSPGGTLLVQAQFLNDDRTSPRWATLLNLIQLIATPQGRNHAVGETIEWMEAAGFTDVQYIRFSLWNVCSCLTGRRPEA